jgi:hypothetical protein
MYFDPYDIAMALFAAIQAKVDAERASRPFSRLPESEPPSPRSEEAERVLRDMEKMAARLETKRKGA